MYPTPVCDVRSLPLRPQQAARATRQRVGRLVVAVAVHGIVSAAGCIAERQDDRVTVGEATSITRAASGDDFILQPTLRVLGERTDFSDDRLPYVLSPDKTRAAFVALEGSKQVLKVNGRAIASFEARSDLNPVGLLESRRLTRPIFSPDSQQILFFDRTGRFDRGRIFYGGKHGPEGKMISAPTCSPDSSTLLYAMQTDEGPRFVINNERAYLPAEVPDTSSIDGVVIHFSPSSQRTAFMVGTPEGTFVLLDDFRSDTYRLLQNPIFSPDSTRFAFTAYQGGNWRVIVDGRPGPEFDHISSPAFSPDSRGFAYIARQGKRWLLVQDEAVRPLKVRFDDHPAIGLPVAGDSGLRALAKPTVDHVHDLRYTSDGQHLHLCAHTSEPFFNESNRFAIFDDQVLSSESASCPPVVIGREHAMSLTSEGLSSLELEPPRSGSAVAPVRVEGVSQLVVSKLTRNAACIHRGPSSSAHAVAVNGKFDDAAYHGITGLTFSPDGRRYAYGGVIREEAPPRVEGQALVVIDGTRSTRWFRSIGQISFSPDSSRVAYPARLLRGETGDSPANDRVIVINDSVSEPFTEVQECKFSADSRHYAFLACDGTSWCIVVDGRRFEGVPSGIQWIGPLTVEGDSSFVRLGFFCDSGQLVRLEVPCTAGEFDGPSVVRVEGTRYRGGRSDDTSARAGLASLNAYTWADSKGAYKVSLTEERLTGKEGHYLKKLYQLKELEISSCKLTLEFLSSLRGLPNLTSLEIRDSDLQDEDLVYIGLLGQLQRLCLRDNAAVSSTGLANLQRLGCLQDLDLSDTAVSANGMQRLGDLNGLKRLNLSFGGVGDDAITALKEFGFEGLQELNLAGTEVTDKGLKDLSGFDSLRTVNLAFTNVSDLGLAVLGQLKSLEDLSLVGTAVTDGGIKRLANLSNLNRLLLDQADITDDCLADLSSLTELRVLSLDGTKLSLEGLISLHHRLRNCRIQGRWPLSELIETGKGAGDIESDLRMLQGLWKLSALAEGSAEVPVDHDEWHVVFGDRLKLVDERTKTVVEYELRIEPNRGPQSFSMKSEYSPRTTHHFALDGDRLTISTVGEPNKGAVKIWRRFRPLRFRASMKTTAP